MLPTMPDLVLRDIPESIETERLLLRPPAKGDGEAVYTAVVESLQELRRYLGSLPWVAEEPSVPAFERFCRAGHANFIARNDFPFLAFAKDSGELVLSCGLHRPAWSTPKIEIGYWCRTAQAGNGYVTEAVRVLAAYAFAELGVARLELLADEENTPSRKVAERTGFTLEGVLRDERRAPDGTLRSTCVYARLARER